MPNAEISNSISIFADMKIPYYALACYMLYPVEISPEQAINIISPIKKSIFNGIIQKSKDVLNQENIEMFRLRSELNWTWERIAAQYNIKPCNAFSRVKHYHDNLRGDKLESKFYVCQMCGKLVWSQARENHIISGHRFGIRNSKGKVG
jgi:hypothetical protein